MLQSECLKSLARQQARRTLLASEAFRALSANEQALLCDKLAGAYEIALLQQARVDFTVALASLQDDDLAAEFLNALDFPKFVSALLKGVFDANLTVALRQMEAYAELLKEASKSVAQFADDNVTETQARKWLLQQLLCDADAEEKKRKPSPEFSARELKVAKTTLAREQRRLLRELLLMGVARLLANPRLAANKVFFGFRAERIAGDLRFREKLIRKLQAVAAIPLTPPLTTTVRRRTRGAEATGESPAETATRELSGAIWVGRFLGSKRTEDLENGFRQNVERFLSALRAAGATIVISATLRPPERAYLMHWSWKISKGLSTGENIPEMPGVNINWWHGNVADTLRAAQEMVAGYGLQRLGVAPALASRHTQGRAIDMSISWPSVLPIKKANGQSVVISSQPRNGANAALINVGRTYNVIHFINVNKDVPHWSTDGR